MTQLSVIVTAFNIESLVGECLEDIARQTLRDIEIIVVDDGSSDGTPEVIRDFAAGDSRVSPVLLRENSIGGVATPANTGIELATGRYIGFADGDDRFDATMFEKLVGTAERTGAELTLCNYLNWDIHTGETELPPDESRWKEIAPEGVLDLDTSTRHRVLALNAVPWRKLYDARLLKQQGLRFPVGTAFFEDNPFHWFNVLSASRIAFVDERLCWHRVNRAGQTTSSLGGRRLLAIFRHHDTIFRWLGDVGLDAEYGPDLLIWTGRQLSWIGRKCPVELRPDLFREISAIMAAHPDADFDRRAMRDAIGKRASRMMLEARKGNFDAFCRCLEKPSGMELKNRPKRDDATSGARALLRGLFAR